MNIRPESPSDYNKVYTLIKSSFQTAEHADGNEQDLVTALRLGSAYIPELSLVAEVKNQIVGHIMFTKAKIDTTTVLALAPLSVLPEYQRKGIGSTLIKVGHEIAAKLGYEYSIVLGSEKYYPKFGYLPAHTYGIYPPFTVPRENFMAYKLNKKPSFLNGTLIYAKEFGI